MCTQVHTHVYRRLLVNKMCVTGSRTYQNREPVGDLHMYRAVFCKEAQPRKLAPTAHQPNGRCRTRSIRFLRDKPFASRGPVTPAELLF